MDRIIKNKELNKKLAQEGLSDISLVKGDGYFYITGNNSKGDKMISETESFENPASFYLNSLSDQSVDSWIKDIKRFFENGDTSSRGFGISGSSATGK